MKQRSVYVCSFIGMIGVVLTLSTIFLTSGKWSKPTKVYVPEEWLRKDSGDWYVDSVDMKLKNKVFTIIKEGSNP